MQPAPLQTNAVTIDVLQRLFFTENKPSSLTPLDIAILAYLILRRTTDHSIHDSHLTIAERVCSDRRTVSRSLRRLEKAGWVSVGGRGAGRSKAISINIEKLPAAQPIRAAVTIEAKQLASRYHIALQKRVGVRKFPKNWLTRQAPSAQRILTHCEGNLPLACEVIGHALSNPKFKLRASKSLYHVLVIWPSIMRSYQQAKAALQNKGTEKENGCSTATNCGQ